MIILTALLVFKYASLERGGVQSICDIANGFA